MRPASSTAIWSASAHFPGVNTTMRRIAAAQAFDLDGRLGQIRTPALVVATMDEDLVLYGCAAHLAAGLTRAGLPLPRGGHSCSVVDPTAFNPPVIDFLIG